MDHLSAIRSFVEIADQGSLTRAADTLDLSRAMISRHLEALERWLGARPLGWSACCNGPLFDASR
ncbi:MAG: LysR family transcriptional regulator [Burkholderiales bacterium]